MLWAPRVGSKYLVERDLQQGILPPLQLCHSLLHACQALLMLLQCSILHTSNIHIHYTDMHEAQLC